MRNEDYDKQKKLFERFIENSNIKDFDKMKKLSETNNYQKSYSNRRKFNSKNLFHSFKHDRPSYVIYKKIKNNNSNSNDDYFNGNDNDIRESYTPHEINNYKLDYRNIIFDPQYKNKCLKGNYKWGNMKFNQQKLNMAKRRGVSLEDFKMHKIDKNLKKKNTMEINGRLIIGNNNNIPNNNRNQTENSKENKKMIIDSINKKNSDFIKRKYSGQINGKILNNFQSNHLNNDGVYDLVF